MFVLSKAVFGILFWPLAAILGLIAIVGGLVVLFSVHWAFGVLFLALIVAAIAAFALWERRHPTRP
ncbi:MAG: hypothetical protein ACE5IZ_01940 [Dehalococcoidia bacterium]